MSLGNANPQHLLRMEKYISMLKDEMLKLGLKSVVSLPLWVKQRAWSEAVRLTETEATNMNAGFKPRDMYRPQSKIIIINS